MHRCSGCRSRSCFSMLWTYMCAKSGLSTRKLVSCMGDDTISLRLVNEDTSQTCISFIMQGHTLDIINQQSAKHLRWGVLLYHRCWCCLLGSQQQHQLFVWQNSCSKECPRYFIRQHNRFALLSLAVCVFDCWHCQPNMLTMRKCVILQYLSYFIVSSMNSLQSIAVRWFQ
jgi:hypothetical protein